MDFGSGKAAGRKVILNGGGCYEGFFDNGNYNGKGRLIYPDGSFIEGFFTDGVMIGIGKHSNFDRTLVYEGEFKNFEYHGNGKLTRKTSSKSTSSYTGKFENGLEDDDRGLYVSEHFTFFGKFFV